MGNQSFDSPRDALAHFGVLGMKWGRRKSNDPMSVSPRKQAKLDRQAKAKEAAAKGAEARARNRELNKASARAEADRIIAESNSEGVHPIEGARMRTFSGANGVRLKVAKEQYVKDKEELGSDQAKKNLRKVRDEIDKDWDKSKEFIDGKEFVEDFLRSMASPDNGPDRYDRTNEMYKKYRA